MATPTAPRMTYSPWLRSQDVVLGATGQHEWYWRCPVCRHHAGPYPDALEAKEVGASHHYHAHGLPAGRRSEAHKAARRTAGRSFTIAMFDKLTADLAQRHNLTEESAARVVKNTADTIQGHGSVSHLVWLIDHEGMNTGRAPTRDLVDDVAARLGYQGSLTQRRS